MSLYRCPQPYWGKAWTELTDYVRESIADGGYIDPIGFDRYLTELKRKALAPVADWIRRAADKETPAAKPLSQVAYEAYGQSTGGLNYQGQPMPAWEALPQPIRQAWHAAANAVLVEVP